MEKRLAGRTDLLVDKLFQRIYRHCGRQEVLEVSKKRIGCISLSKTDLTVIQVLVEGVKIRLELLLHWLDQLAFQPKRRIRNSERDHDCRIGVANLLQEVMHAHSPLTKGMADRWSLEVLLASGMRIYAGVSDKDRYTNALVGTAELALKGCTTVYDMCLEVPVPSEEGIGAVATAYADTGLRAVIAPMISDRTFFQATAGLLDALPGDARAELKKAGVRAEQPLDAMRRIIEGWKWSYDSIRPGLAPTIPLHCSEELLTGCRNLQSQYGVTLQSHLQESKVQLLSAVQSLGKTQTAHLQNFGLLGPSFVAAHGVWLNDDDMRRLGEAGSSVSHNPGSNTILGSGLADARKMIESGINLSIGTDGSNCSDNLNMYEAMRAALRVSHVRSPDIDRWLSAKEVFHAATVGGAKACGMEHIGRIAPGYRADIVFLDLSHPNWIPTNNVLVQLVQSEDGNAVDSVMVGGDWVVYKRALATVNLEALRSEASSALGRLMEAGEKQTALFEKLMPVVRCFCPAMAAQPYRLNRYGSALGE
ncbi:amidohydrolase family protein [uncultured Variovorax sp.]|uniref:amidohydrolase family protein n=1 Tax=uncultured Variovorax sp. TaxID=114708 RepID=UPI00260F7D9E|nr:amidohydrolase family protein [uncultured Variovorax sp.]